MQTRRHHTPDRGPGSGLVAARPVITLALVVTALGALLGCSVNPVTGKNQLMLMSESQEIQVGTSGDQQIVAMYGTVPDPTLAAYVDSIGQAMVRVCHRRELRYRFRVLDDPVVNAFALPGGFVYLTRGILAYLDSESAMAGVLGHEIGHVAARHSAERYTTQTVLGVGLGLGSVLSEEFARYAPAAGAASQLLLLKFGRDDERQSDQLGVEYATRIGYDTTDMAAFFGTLDALSGDASALPSWASTHPDPGERYVTVNQLTEQWEATVGRPSYVQNRDRYLNIIDGIVFGKNPRQGFVESGHFNHPDLAFRFPVPAEWKVENTASQVQIVSPDGEGAVLVSIAPGAQSPDAAADDFLRGLDAQVRSRQSLTISGYPAVRLESDLGSVDALLIVISTFVQKDGHVYVFHGVSPQASAAANRAAFLAVADGFGPLTIVRLLRVQPARIRVITASEEAAFSEVVRPYPIPERSGLDLAGLALLNGVTPTALVKRGDRVKVLVEE